jgi:hypothetical protein
VHTNGGTEFSLQVGTVKNFGEVVWLNAKSLASILLMATMQKVCHITMDDTLVEAAMHVH